MNAPTATAEATAIAAATLTPPAPGERWPGQGGFFICTLPPIGNLPARHLVADTEIHDGLRWGDYGREIAGATSRFDGAGNTKALIEAGEAYAAAHWAAKRSNEGHEDYFLPSQLDLFMALCYAPQLFDKDVYWSSTQASRLYAFAQLFEYGNSVWVAKTSEFRVRAFRTIHLNA